MTVTCTLPFVHEAIFPDQGKRGGGGKWILGTFMSWVSLKSSPIFREQR